MSPRQVACVPVILVAAIAGAGGAYYLTRPVTQVRPPAVAAVLMVPPAERTVSWFEAHEAEMTQKLRTCKNNPGDGMHDPECLNASDAKEHVDVQKFLASAPK